MAELLHPGVYIQETSFRGAPIEGVATSTAGFVGRAQAGPVGVATLVTSFTEFTRTFGQPYSNPQNLGEYMGTAVRNFFVNGGLRVYIVRVLGAGAQFATIEAADGAVALLPSTVTVRGPTTTLPLNTLRNINVGAKLDVFTRPSPSGVFTFKLSTTVVGYDAVRATVQIPAGDIGAGITLDPANTYVVVDTAKPKTDASSPSFTAINEGASGNSLAVQIRPNDLPPVRLATHKVLPGEPVLTNAGPGLGATSFALPAAQMRQVRSGDTLDLSNGVNSQTVTVGAIGDATVNYKNATGTGGAAVTGALAITSRGGVAIGSPGPTIYTIGGAGITFAAGATGSVALPHSAAALLQSNDILTLGGVTFTVDTITYAATVPLTGSATNDYSSGTVTLTAPGAPDGVVNQLGRLIVADVSSLNVPARLNLVTAGALSPEPIVVTDGVSSLATTIVFVDAASNTVMTSNTSWAPIANIANWTSFEDLQVAVAGSPSVQVSSVAQFYKGGIVRLDDGANPVYGVVGAVDPVARTVSINGGVALPASLTGYIDVPAATTSRNVYLSTLEIDFVVYQAGVVVETFTNLSWNNDPSADSFRKYYIKRINDPNTGSAFVTVTPPTAEGTDVAHQPTTLDGWPLLLAGGDDGAAPINIDIIGVDNGPGHRTGIQSLIEPDDIAIVAVPGVTDQAVQEELIAHCERLKYRFAVLDGIPHTSDVSAIQAHRNNYDSQYAAYYEPWLEELDLSTGNTVVVPPSGAVIGIYANVDNERGVFKAPANEVVEDVLGLEFQFGNGEQDVLNPVGVNLIRTFTGRGIRVWGARTISSNQDWKYVNVRRLFIYLEHSIDLGTQWVVFEPNNEALWAKVVSTITAFLVGVWKTGALMGTKPEEAFFVKCDRTTMTQDDIDNGRLIVLIGVAPTFPAEFVVFQIGQFTASAPSG
jgi:phage tail sheath protein FI